MKMPSGLTAAGLAIFAALASPAHAQTVPTTNYPVLLDSIWKTIDENFYDPHFRGVDWSAVGKKYRRRVATVRDQEGFQRLAGAMLGELRASHLDLLPPRQSDTGGAGIGAQGIWIGREMIVAKVSPLSDAWRKGVRSGDRIDNPDKLGGVLGSEATLSVSHCDGRSRAISVRREAASWHSEQPSFRWSTISTAPDRTIGYLRVDRFDDDGAETADKAMADLAQASALILDIRYNSGGNASALRLASYFTGPAQPAFGLLMRDWLKRLPGSATKRDVVTAPRLDRAYTTDKVFAGLKAGNSGAMLWTEDLGSLRWSKPVVVLIGADTGSAAEAFGWIMKWKSAARLVGTPTAGALLGSEIFDVGQGWSLRLPVHGIWSADGEDFGDRAVEPDVRVETTRADLCAGRDPQLATALDIVSSSR